MSARVWSPSDVTQGRALPPTLRLAGRVVAQEGQTLLIADALSSVRVELAAPTPVPSLAWVLLAAESRGSDLAQGRIVECREPRGTREFERLWGGVGKALQARAQAHTTIRRYFDEQGFLAVDTPTRVTAPGTDVHIEPIPSAAGYLITSPEFHMKRLLVGGLPRIYQFAHVFRSGEQGLLHQSEFLMLEWYRAHEGYASVLADTEQIVSGVIAALNGSTVLRTQQGEVDCTPPFERITVQHAFAQYAGVANVSELAALDEDRYFELLVNTVEPTLAQYKKPVFLCDYPLSQAALARPCPNAPEYAERFELYLAGVELCNGYGELTDAALQRARFEADNARRKARGQAELPLDEEFLSALDEGLPACAGNALGFDRLLMLALGEHSLERVIAFPAKPG